ncbi:MAG: signal peptidase I [Oscillospiraceae bacterium]|jgi:signal peptidase I
MTLEECPPVPEEKLPPRQTIKLELYFWLQAMVFALVCIILVFTFVGRIIGVEGESMEPTLLDGDMLLLQSIGYHPKQGDIVVLTKESFMEQPIVKRVIAVGGQTVRIDYEAGEVRVDGAVLDEPYINELMQSPGWDNVDDITVPEGSIFVMGDNRNHSTDSRAPQVGTVDERDVLGRALLVLFPFQRLGGVA